LSTEDKKKVGRLFRSLFVAIMLIGALLAVGCFSVSLVATSPLIQDSMRTVAMIISGAVIANLISEYVLGDYYRQQARDNMERAVSPDFDELKRSVSDSLLKTVPMIKEETVGPIEEIRKRVSDASDFMLTRIGVLRGAKSAGIINIFPNRYELLENESLLDTIRRDVQAETNQVRLMGISLGDYFLDRGVLHTCLIDLLEKAKISGVPKLKALIVHPKCAALRERARWEAGEDYYAAPAFYDSTTFIETDGAARIAKRLCQKYGACLEVRLYNQAPTAFLLLTSRFAFYEPYDYAARGSNVPVTQIQAEVALYKHYETHFDRVWSVAEPVAMFDSMIEDTKRKPSPDVNDKEDM
jgi:hypothetical protein